MVVAAKAAIENHFKIEKGQNFPKIKNKEVLMASSTSFNM